MLTVTLLNFRRRIIILFLDFLYFLRSGETDVSWEMQAGTHSWYQVQRLSSEETLTSLSCLQDPTETVSKPNTPHSDQLQNQFPLCPFDHHPAQIFSLKILTSWSRAPKASVLGQLQEMGWGGRWEGVQDGADMCTVADSCQCMAKTHHNIVK